MSQIRNNKDMVIVCSICSESILITRKSYEEMTNYIDKGITNSVLFRTTICIKCENKISLTKSPNLIIPEKGYKIPLGTSMIMEWPVYRRISLFMRKYCKLYEYDDTLIHTIENRDDIFSEINDSHNIYRFHCSNFTKLENSSTYDFFLLNDNQQTKRRRLS